MKQILLVEDNRAIVEGLIYTLEKAGFCVTVCENVVRTRNAIKKASFDLIILDVSLPDGDGFALYPNIRKEISTPIIFLTAKDEEDDIVQGLELGAEDYITKPFKTRELISRINRILRRNEKDNRFIKYKNLKIDIDANKVFIKKNEIFFTALEYKILMILVSNQGKVVTREILLERIWDVAGNFVNDNTLTVYIKRIREKMGTENYIKTNKGIGYRIE